MKKEQEAEAARRVAEERGKRTTYEKQHQQTIASEPVKSKVEETPKPSSLVQAAVPAPAPVVPSPDQDKPEESKKSSPPAMAAADEPVKVVEKAPVAPLSIPIKTETNNSDDDEWNDETNEVPRSSEPLEPSTSEAPDEGLKCIARYAYEKSQFTHACNMA